jgi:hypothetical protein
MEMGKTRIGKLLEDNNVVLSRAQIQKELDDLVKQGQNVSFAKQKLEKEYGIKISIRGDSEVVQILKPR